MAERAAGSGKVGRFRSDQARNRFLAAYDTALEYWPTRPEHRDIDTSFGTTHVLEVAAAAGSPIVLLHAIAVSSPAWYADIAALSASRPVYAIDTITDPGRSRQSAAVQDGRAYAVWLNEVLTGLRLDHVHLVGLSYGGWLALNQAHRAPERLASVAAVDPVGAIGRVSTAFMVKAVPDALLALAKSEEAIHRLLGRLNNGAVPTQPLLDLSVAGLLTFRAKQPSPKRMTDQELGKLALPTLLFFCEHSPVNDAQRAAERARGCIPGVEIEVVTDAGHMLPVEQPMIFTDRLLSFVERVDAI